MTDPRPGEKVTGGCLCGAIRYEIKGAAHHSTHCHCLHCRRSTGAAIVTWTTFRSADFGIVTGTPSRYESRPQVTRQFCGRCGSQLTYQSAQEPESIDVTSCSLDSPEMVSPQDHVWCDRMLPWLKLADGLPRYARDRTSR
jgi:hypothetical protein